MHEFTSRPLLPGLAVLFADGSIACLARLVGNLVEAVGQLLREKSEGGIHSVLLFKVAEQVRVGGEDTWVIEPVVVAEREKGLIG